MSLDVKSLVRMSTASPFNIFRLSPRMHILPSLCIYLTSACNYDCVMCESRRSLERVREHMKLEIVERLIRDCGSLKFKPRLHFSGLGEPLVYPHVNTIMELCKRNKLHWSITTNGLLIKRYVKDLVEHGCCGINLSVHGIEEVHDKIVGTPKAFKTVLSAVNALDGEKNKNGKQHPRVAINCVVTNNNVMHLQEIYDYLKDWPINSVTFQHVSFSKKDYANNASFRITEPKKLDHLISFVESVKNKKYPVPIHFFPIMDTELIKSYHNDLLFPSKIHCFLPWLSLRIYPDGQVKMCEQPFGNIESQSIREIMNNDSAIRFRKHLRKKSFNSSVCFRCCHRVYA